ncbi:MAG: hypothetical protein P4L96_18100 [Rhodoferax sp.]|nr:hypothetical protein [Rhodoferax sp.]
MTNYFERLPLAGAEQLEQLSRLLFELRENRKTVLRRYGVDSEEALLDLVREQAIAEHPGYDDYLGACILAATREVVRSQMQAAVIELGG